jgi:hypothetical protein
MNANWHRVLGCLCAVALVTGLGVGDSVAQNARSPTSVKPVQLVSSRDAARRTAQKNPRAIKPYYIEFRARAALTYGHTFAVIARNGEKLTAKNVVGLHPATESSLPWMIGHVIPVPSETGFSDGDIEDEYIIARYRVPLTEPEHEKLMAFVTKLKADSPVWHAVLYNCSAFVGTIASFMGLRTPWSTLLLPQEYITQLKELNSDSKPTAAMASTNP